MLEPRSSGISYLTLLVCVVLCGGLTWLAVVLGSYFLTDRAYENMIAGPHGDIYEVEAALDGFNKSLISDRSEMGGQLSAVVQPGMEYTRYSRYCDMAIDVVYDKQHRVVAVWPAYD